ncbi:MAG: DUF1538 domain-containing protein [Gammaproteobacteria bacterium]
MDLISAVGSMIGGTAVDVVPVALFLFLFHNVVLKRRLANKRRILAGFLLTVIGLSLFLLGLEQGLFPLGRLMAEQLTAISVTPGSTVPAFWLDYYWVYIFAFMIGFSTTVAEPALLAVALKAHAVSGGAIRVSGLRVAIALGVAAGVALGCFRIVTGTPLAGYIIAGYVIVVAQTVFAPRLIVPLAYDSGGVTTSTVTVPLVTALGLGLAEHVPGRNPLLDGFGLIAFASLFPIMSVLAYAQLTALKERRRSPGTASNAPAKPIETTTED